MHRPTKQFASLNSAAFNSLHSMRSILSTCSPDSCQCKTSPILKSPAASYQSVDDKAQTAQHITTWENVRPLASVFTEGRVLSKQEEGVKAAKLRKDIVQEMKRNQALLSLFIPQDWDSYILRMSQSGTWGGMCPRLFDWMTSASCQTVRLSKVLLAKCTVENNLRKCSSVRLQYGVIATAVQGSQSYLWRPPSSVHRCRYAFDHPVYRWHDQIKQQLAT